MVSRNPLFDEPLLLSEQASSCRNVLPFLALLPGLASLALLSAAAWGGVRHDRAIVNMASVKEMLMSRLLSRRPAPRALCSDGELLARSALRRLSAIETGPLDSDSEGDDEDDEDEDEREAKRARTEMHELDFATLQQAGYRSTSILDSEEYKRHGEQAAKAREEKQLEEERRKKEAEELDELHAAEKQKLLDRTQLKQELKTRFDDHGRNFQDKLRLNRKLGNHGTHYDLAANEMNRLRFQFGDGYWAPEGKCSDREKMHKDRVNYDKKVKVDEKQRKPHFNNKPPPFRPRKGHIPD